jgi:hypothetical protein
MDTSHIQTAILQENYKPEEILNADETSIVLNPSPRYAYLPKSSHRAFGFENDDNHLLSLLLTISGSGRLLPAFYVLKNGCQSADQSRGRVIQNLEKALNDHNWVLQLWEKSVNGVTHSRWYIHHKITQSVITSNPTAFLDHVTLIQYVDTVLQPALKGSRALLIWDNFAAHTVSSVKEAMMKISVRMEMLPANTTNLLQPLDVYLNGVLKRLLREKRATNIFEYLVIWRYQCHLAGSSHQLPDFVPPKSTTSETIITLENIFRHEFVAEEVQKNIIATFINCSLCPHPSFGFLQVVPGQNENPAAVSLCGIFESITIVAKDLEMEVDE